MLPIVNNMCKVLYNFLIIIIDTFYITAASVRERGREGERERVSECVCVRERETVV